MLNVTHVLVVSALGHREIVSVDAYLAAPSSYTDATHARLLSRRDLIRARAAARVRR